MAFGIGTHNPNNNINTKVQGTNMARYALMVTILLMTSFMVQAMGATANPLPPPADSYGDVNPYISEYDEPWNVDIKKNLTFVSENIRFTVHERWDLSVEAEYVFFNKGGEHINATITLPFLSYVDKEELDLYIDGSLRSHGWQDYMMLNTAITGTNERFMEACEFQISVPPGGTITALVKYEEGFYYDADLTTERFEVRYLTTTGRLWPDPIEDAMFIFEVPKDQVAQFEETEGKIKDKGDKFVVTFHYEDWIPAKNIVLRWWKYSEEGVMCLASIVLLIVIPIIIALVIVKYRRKRAEQRFFVPPGAQQPYQGPIRPYHHGPPGRPPPHPPPSGTRPPP